ncbi:MAG: hypothetical protein OEW67_10290 [Cyclobacteriaceae bacterium]|nr:hypothetical protein [Cyclobacteriaceae bacterium]
MRNRLLIGLAVMILLTSFRHPMHVSVTEIEIDTTEKSLKVITHIFMDDIEKSYRTVKKNNELDITDEKVKPDFKNFLESYFLKNIVLSVNGKMVEVTFLGYEEEGDGLWCYLEAVKVKKVKTLEVKNTILIDEFEDQANLVHVEKNKKIKSAKLDRKTTKRLFVIEE